MPIEKILSSTFLPFIGLIFLLFFVTKNVMFSKLQKRFFITAIAINLVLLTAISFDYIFSQLSDPNIYILRRFTSFLNVGLSPLIPLLLLHIFQKQKLHWVYYLPFVLNFIICFASMFVKIVSIITPQNTYERGVLFFVPLLTAGIYVLALIAKRSKARSRTRTTEKLFLFSVVILLSMCLILEILFGYLFLSWNCTAICLILYYLLLCIQNWLTDSLTGCYNRSSYLREIEHMNRRVYGVIVLIDINNFKKINDNFGHNEGDKKLRKLADLMLTHLHTVAKVYRIGGDEFVLLSAQRNRAAIEDGLATIRETAEKDNLTFAYGLVEYFPSEEIQIALKQADKIMYANKNIMKGEENDEGTDLTGAVTHATGSDVTEQSSTDLPHSQI